MKPMTEKQRRVWAGIRQQGRWNFVLRQGLLRAGLGFALLSLLSRYFAFPIRTIVWHGFPGEFYRFIYDWLSFGILFPLVVWYLSERRYRGTSSVKAIRSA